MSEIAKLLEQWANVDKVDDKAENEITAEEYAELIDRGPDAARRILKQHVKDGTWMSRKSRVNGKSCTLFWPVSDPDGKR